MSEDEERFIDGVGDILASWSLSRATGRVYGLLLVRTEPVTSDELRAELRLSAGAVSAATRELAQWGLARTIPQPGSRRLLFEAAGGFEQLLAASHERARRFVRTLRAGQELTHGAASERLRDVTGLFEAYIDAGDDMLRRRAR